MLTSWSRSSVFNKSCLLVDHTAWFPCLERVYVALMWTHVYGLAVSGNVPNRVFSIRSANGIVNSINVMLYFY